MAEPNMINPFEEDIKANEQEAAAIAQEFQPEPYAQTRLAQQEEMKSWRQMLIDSHKKREEERTKRLRNERILGIGKALGDLLGAAFAGAGSTRGNYAAVVPQAQAPKSVERVQQLINEGVVNARDYDKMMQTLAMQEGKDRIALAKAMDEIGIKQSQLAEQREYEKQKLKDAHERELEKIRTRGEWQRALATLKSDLQSAREAKKAENAVVLAKIKGKIQERIKQLGGVGNLDWFTYESLQELFPGEVEFTTTTTAPDKYGEPQTKTVSGTRKQPQGTAQAKMTAQENEDFAKRVGLKIEEKQSITELRALVTKGRYTEEQIKLMIAQARKEGKSVADLIKLLNPKK